jgi:hypothetical protein
MPERIQRSRQKGWRLREGAVIVDRTSRWGNPHTVAEHGRERAVALHREQLYAGTLVYRGRPVTVTDVQRELRGRDLACVCGPDELCHADTLGEAANGKWCAVHRSGVRIEAEDWPAMVRRACAVRIRVGIEETEG